MTRRFELTDAQWAALAPLLPAPNRPGRPSRWTKRQLIDDIRWRVRVGAPWRDVLACYGSWQAVYALFRRWQRAGIWAQIVTRLQAVADAAGPVTWDVSVDSTIARAGTVPSLMSGRPGCRPSKSGVNPYVICARLAPRHA